MGVHGATEPVLDAFGNLIGNELPHLRHRAVERIVLVGQIRKREWFHNLHQYDGTRRKKLEN
jgi:DUF1009 family protein